MSADWQLTEIADFADVLLPQEDFGTPIVVGGHAVNLWASYFLSSGTTTLAEFLPFNMWR